MRTPGNDKKAAVDPKLRRKMLERWENEGGKIQSSDPNAGSTGQPTVTRGRRRGAKDRSTESK